MTTKEMIEVMQAYEDGKTIETRGKTCHNWSVIASPCWNWSYNEYRIKQESKYRPFNNINEAKEYIKKMRNTLNNVWVKSKQQKDDMYQITGYEDNKIIIGTRTQNLESMYKLYTFEDGTPFGIKE